MKVNSTEDWLGADHVYVKVAGASTHTTKVKKMDDGDSFDFLVPLGALAPTLPLTGPIGVEVYDQGLAGRRRPHREDDVGAAVRRCRTLVDG